MRGKLVSWECNSYERLSSSASAVSTIGKTSGGAARLTSTAGRPTQTNMSVVLPRAGRGCYHGNREAIRLYREILKATRLFHWCNEKGEPWGEILRESSRKEFEQARHETDPLVVARLLVVGRQCLNDTIRGLEKTERRIADKITETRSR
ncbi:unnamed protein product [Ectocarpus sp. 12 AP-2014]